MIVDECEATTEEFIDYTLDATLSLCWKMTGLPKDKFPDEDTLNLIKLNTIKHFGEFTFEEILFSFELCINGKFEKDIEHYHTVSPSYVSKVLRGYQEYKRSKINALNKKLELYSTDLLAKYEDTVNKNDHALKNILVRAYHNYRNNGSKKRDYLTPTCLEVIKLMELVTVERNTWSALLEKAKEQYSTHVINESQREGSSQSVNRVTKLIAAFDPKNNAKILVIYAQFEIWDKELKSWEDFGRELVKTEKILPIGYAEKIKEFTEHKENMII